MTIHEMLSNALKGLAPAVGRYPLNERPDTYIAWFEVKATPESASNRWIRVRHMIQVDLYSRWTPCWRRRSTHSNALDASSAIGGQKPTKQKPDTGIFRLPCV